MSEADFCECGCGGKASPGRRYVHGHHRRKPPRVCAVDGCDRPFHTQGYCNAHAYRLKTTGSVQAEIPIRESHSEEEWFHGNFIQDSDTDCWEWQAGKGTNGYGLMRVDGRQTAAHRFAYQLYVGPIPEGLDLDHLCRNRGCVNPGHLEPVTRRENLMRGETITARKAAQTHCIHGHEFTPENTGRNSVTGTRRCRACDRARNRVAA